MNSRNIFLNNPSLVFPIYREDRLAAGCYHQGRIFYYVPMKKKSHTDSKIFIPPSDFKKRNLQYTFIENEKFLPIIKMIDKKFEIFFKKLISLSPHKEILKRRKEDILLLFYDIIYERIRTNPYLYNIVNRPGDMMNIPITESLKRLLKNTNTTDTNEPNYKELMREAVLRNFDLTIDTVFAIPNIVLTSFGSSSYSLKQELKYAKEIIKKYGRLKISDPQEQKLFRKAWKINKAQLEKNIKFSHYATFQKINDKFNFINGNKIQQTKFTASPLYNRYKQYRLRQQKSNN